MEIDIFFLLLKIFLSCNHDVLTTTTSGHLYLWKFTQKLGKCLKKSHWEKKNNYGKIIVSHYSFPSNISYICVTHKILFNHSGVYLHRERQCNCIFRRHIVNFHRACSILLVEAGQWWLGFFFPLIFKK